MGMHHSGAQGANSSSGSKRNTFTRSLSNADVPPDEKAGKFKNVLITYRKSIYVCYIYVMYLILVTYICYKVPTALYHSYCVLFMTYAFQGLC